jgi:CheY-like chemotaxis protein
MNILVVDDNQFILEMIKQMLRDEEHNIFTENSVSEAISFLENGGGCDLVITDIMMPEKDGTNLAQYAKTLTPPLPVLAITGGNETTVEDCVHQAEIFADETLLKPLHKNELVETIARLAG